MAKINDLPIRANPTGADQIIIEGDDETQRASAQAIIDAVVDARFEDATDALAVEAAARVADVAAARAYADNRVGEEAVARDTAIASYVAPVIAEVSQRLRIDAKVLPADMGGTLARDTGYMSPADLKAFMVRADRPMDARVITIRPLINDLLNKAGGGHAIYAPLEYIFVHAPILGLKQGYMPANAASTEFPGYVKFTFDSATPGIASTLYFAVQPSRYDIATHPAQPDATGGYVPLIDVWGDVVAAYPGVNVVTYDDGLLDPFSPIIGPDLFLTDQARPIYPANLFADRAAQSPMVSLSSDAGFAAMQAGGRIMLDPARIATSFSVRAVRQVQSAKLRTRALVVRKRLSALTGTAKIWALGDSILNRMTLALLNAALSAKGGMVTWHGTINSSENPDWQDFAGGPPGEGREGWSAANYLGLSMTVGGEAIQPLAAGDEATYAGLTKAQKRLINPFLRLASESASQAPVVTIGGIGYKFDLAFYATRFAIPAMDIVLLNLGMNDLFQGSAQFAANLSAIIAEIRRAQPLARIVLWATTLPFGSTAYAQYAAGWATILRTIVERVTALRAAGDSNIFLCSAWAYQDPVAGWKLTDAGTEASGIKDSELADYIHPYGVARQQHVDALADALANLWPGNGDPAAGPRFWGASSKSALTASEVAALPYSDQAANRMKAFSVDGGGDAGQYIYYAYPADFGAPAAYRLFGFYDGYAVQTLTVATTAGNRPYTVLRSTNPLIGIVPVELA
ncbi:SGNH/GDSL hydrolase family protein [Sphingomonas sp. VDB2]|uniref:SGNH/GDSL hydrolase family protein n=1 Tax=Sphingomonas sp. VDB2 TaxID=3228751 RepID=UPI003A80830D